MGFRLLDIQTGYNNYASCQADQPFLAVPLTSTSSRYAWPIDHLNKTSQAISGPGRANRRCDIMTAEIEDEERDPLWSGFRRFSQGSRK